MLLPPVGIIMGALVGAFLGELLFADRGVWDSFKASIGAFLCFISGTGMKLICSGIMLWQIIKFAI